RCRVPAVDSDRSLDADAARPRPPLRTIRRGSSPIGGRRSHFFGAAPSQPIQFRCGTQALIEETPMRISVLIACLIGATAMAGAQQEGPHWDYVGKYGPVNWGKLDPAWRACSEGKEQSPIDIRGAHLNKKLQPIEFHYLAGAASIEN